MTLALLGLASAALLVDVRPTTPSGDHPYRVCRYPVMLSQVLTGNSRHALRSDCGNVTLGEFGGPVTFSSREAFWMQPRSICASSRPCPRHSTCAVRVSTSQVVGVKPRPMSVAGGLSPLADHVAHVVSGGSEKQMAWVNTWTNITSMAHKQTFGNRAIGDNPRDSMRTKRIGFHGEASIAFRPYASGPFQATGRFVKDGFREEPFFVCGRDTVDFSHNMPPPERLFLVRGRAGVVTGSTSFYYIKP